MAGIPHNLYKVPAIAAPTREEVRLITENLGLRSTEQDVDAYTVHCGHAIQAYNRVDELDDYELEVKYPRTPGLRPKPDENKYNQWYWRCDIHGASTGKLAGKTVGIKDNVAVAGVPMMNGSKLLEGYMPEVDATVVTRILDAGGRILGKTACEDLCDCGSSFTNAKAPTLNPYDVTRTSGGSSSGSAVAVSINDVDVAIGCDQGGSIRMPSSFCGIVGLKPTYGLVPYTGIFPVDISVDCTGPMARNVADCALLLEVIAGSDGGLDSRQPYNIEVPEYTKLLETDLSGRRVGLLEEGFALTETAPSQCVRGAADKLKFSGITIESVSMPLHNDGIPIFTAAAGLGAYECMIRSNTAGYGWRGYRLLSMQEAVTRGAALRPYDYGFLTKQQMITAEYIKTNYQNKFHSKGHNLVLKLKEAYDAVLQTYDAIIIPTMIQLPPKLPQANVPIPEITDEVSMTNVAPFNVSGHPALTINAGFVDGMPVGMMIVGKHFDEVTVLQIARAFEKLQND